MLLRLQFVNRCALWTSAEAALVSRIKVLSQSKRACPIRELLDLYDEIYRGTKGATSASYHPLKRKLLLKTLVCF